MQYEKRPAFFANRYTTLLYQFEAVAQIGQLGVLLCILIAHREDAMHYTRPIDFWNSQLLAALGISKWETLNKARQAAIEAGWIEYEGTNTRSRGKYRATIPAEYEEIKAGMTEGLYPSNGDNSGDNKGDNQGDNSGDDQGHNQSLSPPSYPPNGDNSGYNHGVNRGEPPYPNPIPNPIPKEEDDSFFVLIDSEKNSEELFPDNPEPKPTPEYQPSGQSDPIFWLSNKPQIYKPKNTTENPTARAEHLAEWQAVLDQYGFAKCDEAYAVVAQAKLDEGKKYVNPLDIIMALKDTNPDRPQFTVIDGKKVKTLDDSFPPEVEERMRKQGML